MEKKRIAVIFGGKSPEHEVSIITGIQVIENLDKELFEVLPVYINKDGRWFSGEDFGNLKKYNSQLLEYARSSQKTVYLDDQEKGLISIGHRRIKRFWENPDKERDHLDVIFPTFHGGLGENGGASGVFEMMDIPYVGPGITGGVLGMDKIVMKQVLEQGGILIAKWDWFYRNAFQKDPQGFIRNIEKKLRYPLFVKPASGGSSIGTNKVNTRKELHNAIEVACVFDNKIVVEESIEDAHEINISVMGNAGSELQVSVCEEVFSTNALLTYEDKYLGNESKTGSKSQGMASTKRVIPANIPKEIAENIKRIAKQVFERLDASGVSRIDFLYQEKTKKIFVIEINTIPGSLSFYLWEASGLSFKDMLTKLVDLAYERYDDKKKNTTTFVSNILENFDAKRGSKGKI
jgi:D-alanine-D-alanine ligase